MVVWCFCEKKNQDYLIACDAVDVACDLHEVVVDGPGVIEVRVGMAEVYLHIDIPYPAHNPVRFPYPVQAAGTAVVLVGVCPGPAEG